MGEFILERGIESKGKFRGKRRRRGVYIRKGRVEQGREGVEGRGGRRGVGEVCGA